MKEQPASGGKYGSDFWHYGPSDRLRRPLAFVGYAGGLVMFGRTHRELEKPPLSREQGSFEILRVWGGPNLPQQYALNATWDDPGAWGLLLADIARHAAKAYSSSSNTTEQEALLRIKQLFDSEWGSPTDEPEKVV